MLKQSSPTHAKSPSHEETSDRLGRRLFPLLLPMMLTTVTGPLFADHIRMHLCIWLLFAALFFD
jgi:hypothetical protein